MSDHEHDLVEVTSADDSQIRDYCRSCGHRGDWRPAPAPWTEDELNELRARAAGGPSTFGELSADGGKA